MEENVVPAPPEAAALAVAAPQPLDPKIAAALNEDFLELYEPVAAQPEKGESDE